MTETTQLIKTAVFKAAPELVWAFLTDKDKLGAWYHPGKENLADGADYKLLAKADDGSEKTIIWGRVLEWTPPRRLVTTFCIDPFDGRETTITWVLSPLAGGTQLTLTHDGIAEAAGEAALPLSMALDKGWDEHLGTLRGVADT
jgi:uncharacterized protein YndB with AHSA1/START domain